jgi:hypothetical protein
VNGWVALGALSLTAITAVAWRESRADLPPGWTAHTQSETAVLLRHDSYPSGQWCSVLAFPDWDGDAPFGWEFWGSPAPLPGQTRDTDEPRLTAETLADVCLYMDARRAKGQRP